MNHYSLEKTIELFEEVNKGWCCTDAKKPTDKSIKYINNYFGMKLPKDLIAFVTYSDKANDWLAGFGDDYTHPTHIINTNRFYSKKRTKRKTGKWERDLPKNFIIINRAFDNDCDCIDLNSYNKKTGEYKICYWRPNMSILEIENSMKNGHASFIEYINFHIFGWCNAVINDKKNNGEIRERSKEKAEKLLRVLKSQ